MNEIIAFGKESYNQAKIVWHSMGGVFSGMTKPSFDEKKIRIELADKSEDELKRLLEQVKLK